MTSRLDEIEARASAATPGPWRDGIGYSGDRVYAEDILVACCEAENPEADCVFIMHARSDIPWLVARVRKLEAALRAIRDTVDVNAHAAAKLALDDGEASNMPPR